MLPISREPFGCENSENNLKTLVSQFDPEKPGIG